MSKRDWKLLLEDIRESIQKVDKYVAGLTLEQFRTNELVIDAVVRNLEIIGEASRMMPEEGKKKLSNLPWNNMVGLRNRIIHEYFGVDLNIIWYIVKNELPSVKNQIDSELEST
ncbi:MAG: DUF86 domain-containing protein [Bacteroidota bacterium]